MRVVFKNVGWVNVNLSSSRIRNFLTFFIFQVSQISSERCHKGHPFISDAHTKTKGLQKNVYASHVFTRHFGRFVSQINSSRFCFFCKKKKNHYFRISCVLNFSLKIHQIIDIFLWQENQSSEFGILEAMWQVLKIWPLLPPPALLLLLSSSSSVAVVNRF